MSASSIPPERHALVVELHGRGLTGQAIAQHLADKCGVKVSASAVARFLLSVRRERGEALKDVVRTKLAPTVLTDIERLDKHIALVDVLIERGRLRAESGDAEDLASCLKAIEQSRKLIDTKLHYAGLDQPDAHNEEDAAIERVARQLDRLAESSGAGGDAAAAGPDEGGDSSPR